MQKRSTTHPLREAREAKNLTLQALAHATGLSEKTIWSAEHNKPVGLYTRNKLCRYFKKTAQELGLVVNKGENNCPAENLHLQAPEQENSTTSHVVSSEHNRGMKYAEPFSLIRSHTNEEASQSFKEDILMAVQEPGGRDMDNLRRQILQQAIGVTSATIVDPSLHALLHSDLLERLLRALKRPASIDNKTLIYLEMTARANRQRFLRSQKSVSMLHDTSALLRTVTQLLEHSLPQHICNRLYTLAGETTQLIGDILFNAGDNETAERYYNVALEMAKEAHNEVLYAVILGRKSFIPIYRGDAQNALPLLLEAREKVEDKASDIIVSWLWAIEAEAYANIYAAGIRASTDDKSISALEQSEILLKRGKEGEISSTFADMAYAPFDAAHLLGYKGICNVRLQNSLVAQILLKERLSKMDETRIHKKSITLVDLATTFVQLGEIEEACSYVTQTLNILRQTRSVRVFQRVLDFRSLLDSRNTTSSVKDLDTLIVTVLSSMQVQGAV